MRSEPFRFNDARHEYTNLDGRRLPHVTGLLTAAGHITDEWFTDESCERGRVVHELAAEYDLGALDAATLVSKYRGYLLGHVAAMRAIPHHWLHIEVPAVSPRGFGGTPDRVGEIYGGLGVLDLKSGLEFKAHRYQTALQAILCEQELGLPADRQLRFTLYLRASGRWKLIEHRDPADIREADRIIERFTRL